MGGIFFIYTLILIAIGISLMLFSLKRLKGVARIIAMIIAYAALLFSGFCFWHFLMIG